MKYIGINKEEGIGFISVDATTVAKKVGVSVMTVYRRLRGADVFEINGWLVCAYFDVVKSTRGGKIFT